MDFMGLVGGWLVGWFERVMRLSAYDDTQTGKSLEKKSPVGYTWFLRLV